MSYVVEFLRSSKSVVESMDFDTFAEVYCLDSLLEDESPADLVEALKEIEKITGEKQYKRFGTAMANKCNKQALKFLRFIGALPEKGR